MRQFPDNSDSFEPYVPASRSLPEITIKALILGVVLAAILTGANAYLGLKVGMTVSASIPAAVMSMAVLRLFRESNILENNIVQTAASAGESLAAGVIFTLPALVLLQYWMDFPFVDVMVIAGAGGIVGVLFTIPLRRALIVESPLRFPEGVATGEVLKAGTEGGTSVRAIGIAALAAAMFKLSQTGFKLLASSVGGAFTAGRSIVPFGTEVSVAVLAVGYIVGFNIAVLVFSGGVIAWLIAIPIYTGIYGIPADTGGYEAAFFIWSEKIRYMGVGSMVVGGIWALVALYRPVRNSIATSVRDVRQGRHGGSLAIPRTERDTPINFVVTGIIGMAVPLFLVFIHVIDFEQLPVIPLLYWLTIGFGVLFALTAGFLFASVAGYMAGLVGSSNNPISGVTIATILTTSLILLALLGSQIDFSVDVQRATAAAATAILVGAVVCCAAAIAGDNMQDLKAGYIVGSTPYRQQIMQIVGVLTAALVIGPILSVLFQAYGLGGVLPREGMDPGEMLAAPQATLMESVARAVFARDLEWGMIAIGGVIATVIILLDEALSRRGSSFRAPVLAVAVGIYLPLEVSTPIFLGGLVALFAGRRMSRNPGGGAADVSSAAAKAERKGLLFASGLITGEALIGIILAIPFALAQSTDVVRLVGAGFVPASNILGGAALFFFMLWLYRMASGFDWSVE